MAVMFLLKIFPFGNGSFLYWDGEIQYVNFYTYLKTVFTSNSNLFYSVSNLGGNNMFDFAAYYNFFSPFNLIFLLFPADYTNIALEILMLIKLGLCGVTFAYFINKEFSPGYYSAFFGLSYALSMHSLITTMSNFILMDGIILLPLVAAGVSKIIKEKKWALFVFALFFSLLTNAYMGYVAIVFSALFLIYKIILTNEKTKQDILKWLRIYCLGTIISIGLNAWLLIPVRFALDSGKYHYFDILDRLFLIKCNPLEVISKLFSYNLDAEFWAEKCPYIFCGILIVVLFIMYFLNSHFSKKERLVDGLMALFLFLSFHINCLFVIWSMGVENPNGTMFRFGYVFIFFMIYLAKKATMPVDKINIKTWRSILIIFGITALAIYTNHFETIKYKMFLLDILFCIFLIASIQLMRKYKNKILTLSLISVIAIIHVINIGYNTYFVFSSQRCFCLSNDIHYFSTFRQTMAQVLKKIYDSDDDYYRIASQETYIREDGHKIYNNSSFLNNYDSMAGYSSFGTVPTRRFYYNIGVPVFMHNMLITYHDFIEVFPVSFLGVKYIITRNPFIHEPYEKTDAVDDNLFIYKNHAAFPFAFLINNSDDIKGEALYEKSPFIPDFQNNIAKLLSGNDFGNIYTYKQLPLFEDALQPSKRTTINNEEHIFFNETAKTDYNYYLTINSEDYNSYEYLLNIIVTAPYFSYMHIIDELNYNSLFLGNEIKDRTVKLDISLNPYCFKEEGNINGLSHLTLLFVEENTDILKKYSDLINTQKCNMKKITSSHYKGSFKAEGDNKLLFISIPYDLGWNIKINGKKVTPIKVFNSMMAIPVSEGESEIDMNYIPKGLLLGIIISLFSLLLLCALVFLNRKEELS